MLCKLQKVIDLPDDILIQTIHEILWLSGVEGILVLERVCKRLKYLICDSRIIWISSLDTLDFKCAPVIKSRAVLLELSSIELRREVVRAIRLQKNWQSDGGLSVTKEILIPLTDLDDDITLIRGIPEADLVFTFRMEGTLEFWCLKEGALVWSFDLESVLDDLADISPYFAFDYELDGRSSIRIAICVKSDELEGWTTLILSCKIEERDVVLTHHLQIEEQYFGIRDRDVNISMCGPFVIHDMTEDSTGQVIIVVNWQTGNVFKLISTSRYQFSSMNLTSKYLVLILEANGSYFEEASAVIIHLIEIVGVRSENHADWPAYELDDLLSQQKGHQFPVELPWYFPGALVPTISVSESEWLKCPETRIMITGYDENEDEDDYGESVDTLNVGCSAFGYAVDENSGEERVDEASTLMVLPRNADLQQSVPTSGRAMFIKYNRPDDCDIFMVFFPPGPDKDVGRLSEPWFSAYNANPDQIHMDSHGAMLVGLLENMIRVQRFDGV